MPTAERLAALEMLLGGTDRQVDLERAWKNLLVGQHHDIQICGLLTEARKFLPASVSISTNAIQSSLQFVASQMKADGILQVTVFNPLSWPHRQWIETDFTLPKMEATVLAVHHGGRLVPSTLLHASRRSNGNLLEGRLAFQAELPGLSFGAYSIAPAGEQAAVSDKVEVHGWPIPAGRHGSHGK